MLGKPLDEKGIIVCNINCTNFTPYVKLLHSLAIPYAVITDGDFYVINDKDEREYHKMDTEETADRGWLGMEIIESMVSQLNLNSENEIPEDIDKLDELFKELGLFVGYYTFEVDMMVKAAAKKDSKEENLNVICDLFSDLTTGGIVQKRSCLQMK